MRAKGKKFKKRYLVIILILLVGGMAGWLANDKCAAANLSDINRAARRS